MTFLTLFFLFCIMPAEQVDLIEEQVPLERLSEIVDEPTDSRQLRLGLMQLFRNFTESSCVLKL